MIALQRTARLCGTVLVEAAAVAALVVAGRRPALDVPIDHLGPWLRDGAPADVLVALLRWVALVGAVWLLASTLLYVVAAASRAPAAMRAVRWSTLPAVRRTVDAVFAVSLATGVVLVSAAASAATRSTDPTTVTVRDGRGRIAQLPPDTTAPSSPASPSTPPPTPEYLPPPASPAPTEVVVEPGDNLWELAARRLADASGRARPEVGDAEIAPYWVRLCDTNRPRLASGDPDLVYPGERVVLPPLS
jgi:nucleoid-associated protein YgaU